MADFVWPLRVYYEDTDSSGVAYHANYLRWFERARTEWLRSLGFGQQRMAAELGVAFTVANLAIDYARPARLDDAIEVVTQVSAARGASVEFTQQLHPAADRGTLLARAQVRVACVDAHTFRPKRLPPEFLARVNG